MQMRVLLPSPLLLGGAPERGVEALQDYLKPEFNNMDLRGVSTLGLAHIGDAVFELMVRTWLCAQGISTAKKLHGNTVEFVSAKAQAEASERLLPKLREEELAVFKRGRNAYANSVPRSSTHEEYHLATALETLFGHLYLKGQTARLGELFEMVVEERVES